VPPKPWFDRERRRVTSERLRELRERFGKALSKLDLTRA
jgi:hypothetical protein